MKNKFKQRVLIIGPIGDFGGREIEAGFIANLLSEDYYVEVCSTGNISKNSQVYEIFKNKEVFSLKKLVFEKSKLLRLLSKLSFIKNKKKEQSYYYVNNRIAKKIFKYDSKVESVLRKVLYDFDLIFIIAQVSSNYLKFIIEESYKSNKKIVFRTTGTIQKIPRSTFFNKVDFFIHHSKNNAERLIGLDTHNYQVVDQCSVMEEELLKLPITKGSSKFLALGMISPIKGFEELIDYFLTFCKKEDELLIVGEGKNKSFLVEKYSGNSQVSFMGYVEQQKLPQIFKNSDCLIISSLEEAGPLVGIEAMAAGKLIISTNVGAMRERLHNTLCNFWYSIKDESSFEKSYNEVKELTEDSISKISLNMKEKYVRNYSVHELTKKYRGIVNSLLHVN